jgi:cytochrome c biogenesis protein
MSTDVDTSPETPEAQLAPQAPTERPVGIGFAGWLRWAWRQLTSMRTALVLLFLLALGSVPGSFLPQQPVDPDKVTSFYTAHKTLAPLLNRLSLFNVFAAPWYAAIYILLFISLTGCVLPRSLHHVKAVRARPPAAPRNLTRLPEAASFETDADVEQVLATARDVLRKRRFRVDVAEDSVAAEKGHLRETGNLIFHVALLGILLAVGIGSGFGYKGNVVVTEGTGFSNTLTSYDAFKGGRFASASRLPPFTIWVDKFNASYLTQGPNRGQPLSFAAKIRYRTGLNSPIRSDDLQVNSPLNIDGTRLYLLGHGYAPTFTVRDGKGRVAFQDSVPFLPSDEATFTSEGVVKVPDAQPSQLGFIGLFLPTAVINGKQIVSAFPGPLNPAVTLFAFKGDLGENNGTPQSVYQLVTSGMKRINVSQAPLQIGQTMTLPGGDGSITFTGYKQWVSLQVNHDPGRIPALVAAVTAILGIIISFTIRRRRVWVRATAAAAPGTPGGADENPGRTVVEVGGLTLGGTTTEFEDIVARLKRTTDTTDEE